MEGRNRALPDKFSMVKSFRVLLEDIREEKDLPCIFISYQREDETYASDVADYITSKQIDVYFDIHDKDLKLHNQTNNPGGVTDAIRAALNKSQYMLVIVSPTTLLSPWVPFEVGYAFDKKKENMKILRHKGLIKSKLPAYFQTKEVLWGTASLNQFLDSVRHEYPIYESILEKGEEVKKFSAFINNPLNKYLDNE